LNHHNRISSQQYGHKYTKDTNLNANNCRAKPAPRLLASMMWKEMMCKEMMCKEMMGKEMMWKEMMWREQNNTETYEYITLC